MDRSERPSFETVVASETTFIRRTLAHLGVHARDLGDVAQEVLRGVQRGLASFDPSLAKDQGNALRAWIFGICERQAQSYRRTAIRRGEILTVERELEEALVSDEGSPEELLVSHERVGLLWRLLAKLEPHRRAVIVAYELEGLEMVEVAAALGIKRNTAWNRLRLARGDLGALAAQLSASTALPRRSC